MDAETRPTSAATPAVTTRAQSIAAGAIALLFGTFVLYGIGFALPEAIHNAAHDSRDSFTFP